VVSVEHVTRRFGARIAVDDVSFEVRSGEVFGLLGPNGAGKTTTLRMLGGLIPPTSGTIRINGQPFVHASSQTLRERIGFLTETPGLWDQLSVEDNLLVYARLFSVPDPRKAVRRTLETFDLWPRRADRVVLLSKGMKQKVAVARALVHEPDVVLLDEPTANLDPQTARVVRDLLSQLRGAGRAVVVSTHNLDEIERVADRVALISGRLIAIGVPADLRREVFGHRLRVRLDAASDAMPEFARTAERAGAADLRIDGMTLSMSANGRASTIPDIVRALVQAGAAILEVTDDEASLEDVYLRLLAEPGKVPTPHAQFPGRDSRFPTVDDRISPTAQGSASEGEPK
jgi:ABC-2 type transport system ATP-binding protein